jgi:hypothetical protein
MSPGPRSGTRANSIQPLTSATNSTNPASLILIVSPRVDLDCLIEERDYRLRAGIIITKCSYLFDKNG